MNLKKLCGKKATIVSNYLKVDCCKKTTMPMRGLAIPI
jgi:hypothetical protein